MVEVLAAVVDEALSVLDGREDNTVEELFSESPVEALDACIVGGLAWRIRSGP
jgi:hypothetical protein